MVYESYENYSDVYGGRMIAEADFHGLSRQASAYLDNITFGRITGEWKTDERVKNACCAVAEVMARHEEHNAGGIASESNGDSSVTFVTSSAAEQRSEMRRVAEMYLSNTGLLYAGAD